MRKKLELKQPLLPWKEKLSSWTRSRYLQLAIFNAMLILLLLLRSAGYFHPFFIISINLIFLISLIAAIFLLGANSAAMFILALVLWLFAGLIKLVKIDIWAERTAIYTYQALVVGVILLISESIRKTRKTY